MILGTVLSLGALLAAVWVLRPELLLPSHELTIRLRDEATGDATSARVQVRGRRFLFRQADADLWTHATPRIGPYVHVDDEITVRAPRGEIRVIATRGVTSTTIDTTFALRGAHVLELAIADWVDPRAEGWAGADPHVHPDHRGGKFYPDPTIEHVGRIARAEGLDLMFLLANREETSRGVTDPPARGTTLVWAEEYRNAFWGHLVVIDAPELVVTEYGATCCAEEQTAWPTLEHSMTAFDVPLAIMAHPRTTEDPLDTHLWPGAGYARELAALSTRADRLHGVAVAGGTNGPWIWTLEPWLDGVRLGRHWAAFGESDRALDRFHTDPPGEPRTFARVGDVPDGPALAAAWIDAARRARTFATTGPIVSRFEVGGVGTGDVLDARVGDRVPVAIEVRSAVALDSLRVVGADGPVHAAAWPPGERSMRLDLTVDVTRDEFLVVDAFGAERPTGRVYPPRVVTSPVWIRTGTPWTVPDAVIARARDDMQTFWDLSLAARGYATAADSSRAFDHVRRPADRLVDFDRRVTVPADWPSAGRTPR